MSSNSGLNYTVIIHEYSKRHYIKSFQSKYKIKWDVTLTSLIFELERIDRVLGLTSKAEIIVAKQEQCIIKVDFKIAGTNESAKTSGDRAIVHVDHNKKICSILLVYSKNDISPPNETQKWKNEIKLNIPEIYKYLF
jgi:hypothetical protein